MRNTVRRFGSFLLDVLCPQSCLGCKVIVPGAWGFCVDCRPQLEANTASHLDQTPLYAPFRYCGPLTKAIHRLKYEERSEFAARLIKTAFPARCSPGFEGVTLVPVPIHPVRLVERGYNQASLLAVALAKRWGLSVEHQWIVRQEFVMRQVGLGRKARAANAAGAFAVAKSALEGKRVVLVDDVVTTGATVDSCRKVLTDAGVKVVGIVAVARAFSAPTVRVSVRAGTAAFGVGL